jgi:glutamate dehydrogenase (NAD(P)+)
LPAAGPTDQRTPYLVTTWHDEATRATGYFVIDRLVGGMCSGGIRMRPGLSEAEVRELARTMSYKMAVLDIPYGGAKSGIDYDPTAPFAQDVLRRFLLAIRPFVAERYATGADLGTHEDDIVAACQLIGLNHPLQAGFKTEAGAGLTRVQEALGLRADGVPITELIAGYGVAECALQAAQSLGLPVQGMTVALQGFGNVGGAAARFLEAAGARITVVADIEGALIDERGLDVPLLLQARDRFGHIDRGKLPASIQRAAESTWRSADVDMVIPAAVGGAVTEANQAEVRCRLLVEAANNPVTPAAERALEARGITILPDFVANAAAAFLFCGLLEHRLQPNLESIFSVTSVQLRGITKELLERARGQGVGSRQAAEAIAEERLRSRARLQPAGDAA